MNQRVDYPFHGQQSSQNSDLMLNNNYGLEYSNRQLANPRTQNANNDILRVPNPYNQNGQYNGQQQNEFLTPIKQGQQIFPSPRGNPLFSPISPIKEAAIVNNPQEQAIFEPDDHNMTLNLEEDEQISLSRGVFKENEKVARSGNKHIFQAAIPSNDPYNQDNIVWPKLIEDLKKNESPIEQELESIFKINQVNILEIFIDDKLLFDHILQLFQGHCQQLRKKMQGKLEIAIKTVQTIAIEEEDLRLTISKNYLDMINDKFLFTTGDQISKFLSSQDKIQKGTEILEGQEITTKESLTRVNKQLELCEPSYQLKPALPDFVLVTWALSQLKEMKTVQADFEKIFTERSIKDCINEDTIACLLKLSEKHIFLKPIERFSFLKEIGVLEKKPTLEKFGEYIRFLISVDILLMNVGQQSESAIQNYKDFLEKEMEDSEQIIGNIQDYKEVLRKCTQENKLLLQYVPEIDKNSKQIDQLIADMNKEIKAPFNEHQKENMDFLEKTNKNKSNILQSLKRLREYMEERRKLILDFQKIKELPFILQTPFDWDISKYEGEVENEIKRLEGLDILISNIKNIDPISAQAEKINQGIDLWLKQNTEHPASKAELEQKILDLQKDIVTLVYLRDSLGLHHIEYSSSEFLHPCFKKEHEHISGIIDKIYDMQDEVVVMNPAMIVNPVQIQKDQAESQIASSKAKSNNKVIFNQDSKYVSRQPNPIDSIKKEAQVQFQYEVDLSKEIILKGNNVYQN